MSIMWLFLHKGASYWCILFWNYGIYYRFTQLKKYTDDGFQGKIMTRL